MIDGITISFAAAIWGWAACWPLSWRHKASPTRLVWPAKLAAKAHIKRTSRPALAFEPKPVRTPGLAPAAQVKERGQGGTWPSRPLAESAGFWPAPRW